MPIYGAMGVPASMAGKRWVSGTVTPAGGAYGFICDLQTIEHVWVSLVDPPTIDHLYSRAIPAVSGLPGAITVNSYKPTATNNMAPAACSAGEPGLIAYFAIGT